jgi:hypothetical protein
MDFSALPQTAAIIPELNTQMSTPIMVTMVGVVGVEKLS